jgi:heptosyltransferase-2
MPSKTTAVPESDFRPRSAFLLRHVGIGDLIWHLPFIQGLAATSRGGRVTVIAPPSTLARQLLAHEPCVERIVDETIYVRPCEAHRHPSHGFRAIRHAAAQWRPLALDRIYLFSDRYQHAWAARLAGIPLRFGLGLRWKERLCLSRGPYAQPYVGPAVPHYEQALAFAQAHGLVQGRVPPKMELPEAEHLFAQHTLTGLPQRRVSLCIGASEAKKQWGAQRFAALATQLLQQGYAVLLLGGAQERAMADAIEAAVAPGLRGYLRSFTGLNIMQSASLLAASSVCIGNDTGATNLAAAVACPTLCVLGERPVLAHDPLIKCLCAPSLAQLDVDAVVAALPRALLGAAAASMG